MNQTTNDLFQSIGNHILDMVGDAVSKVLAYAEVQEGTASVSLFYESKPGGTPVFVFGGERLTGLFYSLWEEWAKDNNGVSWRSASYIIRNGKPNLELIYSDKFNEQLNKISRRSLVVEQYFGSSTVDYSK